MQLANVLALLAFTVNQVLAAPVEAEAPIEARQVGNYAPYAGYGAYGQTTTTSSTRTTTTPIRTTTTTTRTPTPTSTPAQYANYNNYAPANYGNYPPPANGYGNYRGY